MATATFEGYSEASHDAEPTRATCTIRYRLFAKRGAVTYYHQLGKVTYGSSGPAFNAGCFAKYGALRTAPAGSKLRAEFGFWDTSREAKEDGTYLFWEEGMVRGYLTRV
jgi:hypothetical protein